MKVLIAGGGIGGLTAALCLHEAGHDVRVFERAPKFEDEGAGIQLAANATKVLDALDLLSKLSDLAVEPESIDVREFDTGDLLYQSRLGAAYRQKYRAPYFHLHRSDLIETLATELLVRAPGSIQFGAAVTKYSETEKNVSVQLENGTTECGDCLVGADGIRSAVRTQMRGKTPIQWTGNVAWRGVLDATELADDFMEKVVTNFVAYKKHMVVYYVRAQKAINFVGVVENRDWRNDSWVQKSPHKELMADFAGWNETVQTVVNLTPVDQCYRWALHDYQPLDRWCSKRVTLLGDAAHASLPFLASGAAMAIEDARILQRVLEGHETTTATRLHLALVKYQRNRMSRTASVQKRSRNVGQLYHLPGRLLRRAAFKALGTRTGKNEHFLPQYDANIIPLV
ncbi:MAG: NAD(P)-binding protein [Proteobacteria bacterium]|nr:NAD(P)-binding protein [Pseudomonadota bacterium]